MGILNVTPDSFSDGGAYDSVERAVERGHRMASDGAALIDVGGESTRPGACPVPAEEEQRRVVPVIRALAKRLTIPISIDTSKADVAEEAVAAGASMVNDVTALRGDPRMAEVVAKSGVSVVLMHMRGAPRTMQRRPRYRDVVCDVSAFLAASIQRAERAGIRSDRILIDPGLGFGKTLAHNLRLMQQLEALQTLGKPLVLGPSRKSFIGLILRAPVGERLAGTLACVAYAMREGVEVVRVHDVKPVAQFLTMWQALDRQVEGKHSTASLRTAGSRSRRTRSHCRAVLTNSREDA